jgi:hypothetical protein
MIDANRVVKRGASFAFQEVDDFRRNQKLWRPTLSFQEPPSANAIGDFEKSSPSKPSFSSLNRRHEVEALIEPKALISGP